MKTPKPITRNARRVLFSQGSKGGVGKTGFMLFVISYFLRHGIPVRLINFDVENKTKGSLSHYYPEARTIDINRPGALDVFLSVLDQGEEPIIIADMGASAGAQTFAWFNETFEGTAGEIEYTSIGLVTEDPASVTNVLQWGEMLQGRVKYLITLNKMTMHDEFQYWHQSPAAEVFRNTFDHKVITNPFRLPDFENILRDHGATVDQVADGKTDVRSLQQARFRIRAVGLRKTVDEELDRVRDFLLPSQQQQSES